MSTSVSTDVQWAQRHICLLPDYEENGKGIKIGI